MDNFPKSVLEFELCGIIWRNVFSLSLCSTHVFFLHFPLPQCSPFRKLLKQNTEKAEKEEKGSVWSRERENLHLEYSAHTSLCPECSIIFKPTFSKYPRYFFSIPNFQTDLFISGNELDLPLCDRDFFVRGIRNAHPIRVLGHLQSNTFDFSIETLQNYYSRIGFMSLFHGEQPLEKWYIKNYTRSQIETFSRIIFR